MSSAMRKRFWILLVVLCLAGAAFAQSKKESKGNYSIIKWGQPKGDWGWTASVASDHKNSILVIRRSDPPILVFNQDGKLVNSFGDGLFKRAHSIDVDRFGFVWATDSGDNVVYKFTMAGKLLMTLGKKGVAGDNNSHDLFNGPNDVAVAPNGDIFVSDGDRNSRIVKFNKDGEFIKIIGGGMSIDPGRFGAAPGFKPSEGIVHAIAFDSKGRLITIESFNPRIQIFDQDGKFIEQWPKLGFMKACGLVIAPDDTVYVGDTDAGTVTILKNGKVVDVIHQNEIRPHNIDLDPAGGLFIADVGGDGPSKMIWKMVKQ
jgi:DNA-binding beta-propeller fold protein YncE